MGSVCRGNREWFAFGSFYDLDDSAFSSFLFFSHFLYLHLVSRFVLSVVQRISSIATRLPLETELTSLSARRSNGVIQLVVQRRAICDGFLGVI